MRLALDATYSVGPKLTGVGVYSHELLWTLAARHPEALYYFCYRPHRLIKSFERLLPSGCWRWPLFDVLPPPGADLFHGLNQRVPGGKLPHRVVTTFHDLFVLTSEYSTPDFRARFAAQARQAAARSDLLICVSAFTAAQVEDLLGVPRERIRVVHHGVCAPSASRLEAARSRRLPVVLCVGSIQTRKNTHRLVEAFERTRPGWRLVLAGAAGYGAAPILEQIANSPRKADISVPGYIDRPTLESLYARSSVFAFPSLDEGFGIPVIEAMAWEIPVLTSDRSSLPEVSGDAALHVNPDSVEDMASALQLLMDKEGLRSELIQRGRDWSAGFTWEKAADQTWAVYNELLR